MRIGIDISQSVYEGTGVATYTRRLIEALIKQGGHEYVFLGIAWGRQQSLTDYLRQLPKGSSHTDKIYSIPPVALSFIWNTLHLGTIERFIGDVDIFHSSDWTEPPARVPKITTIHDLTVYAFPQHLPEAIIENHKARLKWVRQESAAIIADSESTKQDIVKYLDVDSDKIHTVYLGVGEEFFQQKVDRILKVRQKYHLSGDYFLCVGTREPRKNLQRTIKAFQKLKDHNFVLAIGGNFGWGEDVAIHKQVKLLGYVDPQDLPALYSGATGFLYPSLYEGFGLPVLEALACGTLVVTSNRGSLGEIAEGVAIEVDPENVDDIYRGMEQIARFTKQKRRQLVEKGIRHARMFTWEKTARETLAVYKSVVG